jgi:hypothetical protein
LITVRLENACEINLAIRAGGACGFGLGKCGDLQSYRFGMDVGGDWRLSGFIENGNVDSVGRVFIKP